MKHVTKISLISFLIITFPPFCLCRKPCSGWFQNIRNGHCYRAFCDALNFTSAQNECIAVGGHLAHIRNEQEDKFAATLKHGVEDYTNDFWIGIKRKSHKSNEWIYVGTNKKAEYLNFHPNRPDNYGGHEDCVHYVYSQYWNQWNDLQAWRERAYICERHNCINLEWD
ncbi:unnamed protein product [Cylicocyclus nassatus]|uniref:C-type lectin domain-containing protein n=1 Tax=Cylicocyclus nassatus TaxID=53992 RepID=A0AA36GNA9_CYLNA|nr:unnamed protein product [Cylicocyclus nassatus]